MVLVIQELARYKVDIAALNETRFSEESQPKEGGTDYTFIWSRRPRAEQRDANVAFAIQFDIEKTFAIIVSVYAPPTTSPDEARNKLYEDLHALLATKRKAGKLIALSDFKGRVGTDHAAWRGVLDPRGLDGFNDNGMLLRQACTEHRLILTYAFFHLTTREKATWIPPRSRYWHLLDYVLVRRRDQQDVLMTKAIPSADEWTYNRLVISIMRICLQSRIRPQGKRSPDDNDAAISNLLGEKNRLHKAYVNHPTEHNKAAFYHSHRLVQQRLREMQDSWAARKAEEVQGHADRKERKNFFSVIQSVYGPPNKGTASLLRANGSILHTEKIQILQRWAKHFRGVLNRPSTISDAAIARLPQVDINVDTDLPPSLHETIKAVQQLPSRKASGSDVIRRRSTSAGKMWRQGEVPQNFKDATVVHLYKRKGNRQICDNYQDTSLLNVAGKIFARILLNRLNHHLEQGLLPKSQCDFRRHRRTTELIFAARQLQEKYQEMRTHFYPTFVDLTKAFYAVNREGLWKIMQKFGCPERFTQMLPSSNTEAEVAGPDPRHGRTGADGSRQHLRYAETATTTLERPPPMDGRREATQTALLWRCRNGFPPTRRSSPALQGYREILPEVPADQRGKLKRPHPRPTDVAESSEDGHSNFPKPTASPPPKANVRPANPNCRRRRRFPTTLTSNHLQRVNNVKVTVNGRQLDLLNTSGPNTALGLHQPSYLRPPLPRFPHQQIALTAL
ncbi:hypothetical protein SprV_0401543600 [Sparganum proliferum]